MINLLLDNANTCTPSFVTEEYDETPVNHRKLPFGCKTEMS